MAKAKKTFRFSERTMEVIESRDKKLFPTETEYVEYIILNSVGRKPIEDILLEINKKADRIIEWTEDYSLPNL